jgi:hypothetical protein
MSNAIGGVGNANSIIPVADDSHTTGPDKRKTPEAQNSTVKHAGGTEHSKPANFDLGSLFNSIFSGKSVDGSQFDFGTLIGQLFEGLGKKDGDILDSVNVQATLAHGKIKEEVQEKVKVEGEFVDGNTTFKGSAEAEAHARFQAEGRAYVDKDGVHAEGSVEASAGVSAEAKGSIKGDFGSIDGRVKVSAEVFARAKGRIDADTKGLRVTSEAEVGAKARAEAETNMSALGGAVKGHADANAEAGTGAKAKLDVGLKYDPLTAAAKVGAEAFAGARAGFSANANICGAKVTVQGEVWSGVGVKAEFNAGLADGKFSFSFGVGIAAAVGGFIKYGVEVDLGDFGKALGSVVGFIGGIFDGGKKDSKAAAGKGAADAKDATASVGKTLKDIGGMFDGKSGDGSWAANLIGSAAKKAVSDNGSKNQDENRDEKDDLKLSGSGEIKTSEDIEARRVDSFEERFSSIQHVETKKV